MNAPLTIKAIAEAQNRRRTVSELTLSLPYPVSMNRLWMRGKTGMVKTPRYATWFQAAGLELNVQRPGRIEGAFAADILIQRKDKRRRDLDNLTKGLLDLLQAHGVIEDDSLLDDLRLRWSTSIKGAEVSLKALSRPARERRAA